MRRRPGGARDRSQAGQRVRVRRVGARSRAGSGWLALVRARLHRTRQDRERLVRAGVRQPFPRRRAEPRASSTSTGSSKQLLPAITAAEIGDAAKLLFADDSRVISRSRRRRRAPRPDRGAAARRPRGGGQDGGHGLDRHAGIGGADGSTSPSPAAVESTARDARARRHGRAVRQRRRGLAQADRFQERPGAVHRWTPRRRLAGAADRLSRSDARARATSSCRASAGTAPSICRSCSPARSRRRSPFISLSTHGISGSRGAGGPRDGAAAAAT